MTIATLSGRLPGVAQAPTMAQHLAMAAAGLGMSEAEFAAQVKMLQSLQKAGDAASQSVGPYIHGPGGLLSTPGLERELISTRMAPQGILSRLPVVTTNSEYPYYPYITGITAGSGAEVDYPCDDPPTAGNLKTCLQTAPLGRYERQTRTIDITRIGRLNNRGEMDDLGLLNPILLQGNNPWSPTGFAGTSLNVRAMDELRARLIELGVEVENLMARQVYRGNPANNSANGGYKEFAGFDALIGTGKIDAVTQVACPSLDSDVRNFNYGQVNADNSAIVDTLSDMIRRARYVADGTGLGTVTWVLAMKMHLFNAITDMWPCNYLTRLCVMANSQASLNVDAGDVVNMRDSMRNGRYLVVDGERIDVVIDDGITEYTNVNNANVNAGSFASHIYLIPMTILNGRGATYMEFWDYRNGVTEAAQSLGYSQYRWTDGGRFLTWAKNPVNLCIQAAVVWEPRLVLKTPHIAGKLQNVKYTPYSHYREPFPDDPYFLNGGQSTARATPADYAYPWNPS